MRKRWLWALIALAVIAVGVAAAGLTLSARCSGMVVVTERGVVADSVQSAAHNRRALNRILRWAGPDTTLVFPEGDYYIAASPLGGVCIAGKEGIALRGEGARLINTSYTPYSAASAAHYQDSSLIAVRSARDVTIEGLTLDYVSPTSVSGVITQTQGSSAVFAAYEEFLTGETAVRGGEFWTSVNLFDASGDPAGEVYREGVLEPVEGEPGKFVLPGVYGEVGQQVCVRFTSGTYACPALTLHDVEGLTVRDVCVRACPSASVYATGDNADFTFERVTVASEPGSRSLFSSNEDCIHIQGLRGALTLTDCTFEGIGDDALNVHSLAAVVSGVDGQTLTLANGRTGQAMTGWASAGDAIEVYDRALNLLGTARAVRVRGDRLELDGVPDGTGAGAILHNASRVPEVTAERCTVRRGRARGFLLQAPVAVVRDCTFEALGLSGVLIAPDAQAWYEMGPCREAVLTGNIFLRCGLHDASGRMGAIGVGLDHDLAASGTATPHGAITVTGNRFAGCRCAVSVRGAKAVVERDNDAGGAAMLLN